MWNGSAWLNADEITGPYLSTGPVQFKINVTNTGNVDLTNLTVNDSKFGPISLSTSTLASGASTEAQYNMSWVSGQQNNTANVSGYYNGVKYNDSDDAYYYGSDPSINVSKSGPSTAMIGENVTYNFTVTNGGDVPLENITVVDDIAGVATYQSGDTNNNSLLDTNETWMFTVGYTVLGTDSNPLVNTATVSGYYEGTKYSNTDTHSMEVREAIIPDPSLTLVKTASPTNYSAVGDIISYTYNVTNTGNIEIKGPFNITDDKVTVTVPSNISLIPGDSFEASASYAITQSDLNAGSVTNKATATNGTITSNEDNATVTAIQNPSVTIKKIVTDVAGKGPSGNVTKAGDIITYQINVTNDGNVDLTNIKVNDIIIPNLTGPVESLKTDGILEVGEIWKYTGSYAVSSTDITTNGGGDGLIFNKVKLESDQLNSQSNTTEDTVDVPIGPAPNPSIDIEKYVWNGTAWLDADTVTGPYISSDGTSAGPSLECLPVKFKIIIKNTGNVPLGDVVVTDSKYGKVTLDNSTLDSGASKEATYSLPWASGQQVNIASVSGTYNGTKYNDTDKAYYYGKAAAKPSIDIQKYVYDGSKWLDADTATGPSLSGGPVKFKIVVKNTGTVSLTGITVSDSKYGKVKLSTTTLAAGASTEATYSLSWASGQQVNTATVSGTYSGKKYTDTDKAYYYGKTSAAAKASIDIEKYVYDGSKWLDADTSTGPYVGTAVAGPSLSCLPVQFKIVVKNTGTVPLTGITVSDSKKGKVSLKTTTLAAGASTEVTYSLPWVSGQQVNTATVSGTYSGKKYTDTDKAYYYGKAASKASIDIEKYVYDGSKWLDADTSTGPSLSSGPVKFKIVVKNTGTVPLTGITVSDSKKGKVSLKTTTLAAGASTEVTYSLSWISGQQVNTATVSGTYSGKKYTDTDKAYYYGKTSAKASIDIEKYVYDGSKWLDADTSTGPSLSSATVKFKIVVKNTGTVPLTGITVSDSKKGRISLKKTTLAPGASTEVAYSMTKVCGQQVNIATASGTYSSKKYIDTDKAYYYGKK